MISSDLKEITWEYDTKNSGGAIKEFFRKQKIIKVSDI